MRSLITQAVRLLRSHLSWETRLVGRHHMHPQRMAKTSGSLHVGFSLLASLRNPKTMRARGAP